MYHIPHSNLHVQECCPSCDFFLSPGLCDVVPMRRISFRKQCQVLKRIPLAKPFAFKYSPQLWLAAVDILENLVDFIHVLSILLANLSQLLFEQFKMAFHVFFSGNLTVKRITFNFDDHSFKSNKFLECFLIVLSQVDVLGDEGSEPFL